MKAEAVVDVYDAEIAGKEHFHIEQEVVVLGACCHSGHMNTRISGSNRSNRHESRRYA